jgi:hypothetical protein
MTSMIAYWIAFGPHGPRAVDPPGTNARVAWGVAIGLGVSFAVFGLIRAMAKPAPYTMTKEYQEQANEHLRVSVPLHEPVLFATQYISCVWLRNRPLTRLTRSLKMPTPSPVSPPKATLARARCSPLQATKQTPTDRKSWKKQATRPTVLSIFFCQIQAGASHGGGLWLDGCGSASGLREYSILESRGDGSDSVEEEVVDVNICTTTAEDPHVHQSLRLLLSCVMLHCA